MAIVLQITTDGSCLGNPGPGGWAAIIRWAEGERELFGSEPETTNNRMELTAAIKVLEALKRPRNLEIVTDSQYLRKGVTQYLPRWKQNGWRTKAGTAVANQDLWIRLDELAARHSIRWSWVKGHGNHADQNRCDSLALGAARLEKLRQTKPAASEPCALPAQHTARS